MIFKKRWLQWLLPIAVVLVLVYLRYQYLKPGLIVGTRAPDFSALSLQGDTIHLARINADKYVLLYFWGSWCSICRKENPKWLPVYEHWAGTGKLEIIGIGIEQQEVRWRRAIEADGLPWPKQTADGIGLNLPPVLSISDLYEVKSVPAKYLLKPGGEIVAVNPSAAQLNRLLTKMLQ